MKKLLFLSALLIFACSYGQGEQLYADGTATDQDGNTFEWINYGTQDWAIENAEVVTYRDGTPIPEVTDATEWEALTTGAWSYYENDPTKPRLYNWYAVAGIHDNEDTTPNKEFAPEGWVIPSTSEINQFTEFLNSNYHCAESSSTQTNWISKSIASKSNWGVVLEDYPNYLCTPGYNLNDNNISGFNLMPGGNRQPDGLFSGKGSYGLLVSKTEFDINSAYNRVVFNNGVYLDGWYANSKKRGSTVRFVRGASSVGAADILLNGTISAENHQIKNVADPTDAQDAVTLAYINQLESSNEDLQEQVDNLETRLQAQIDELRNLENWSDSDGDGFTELSGDCNDSDASINPRIYEVSDGVDNNCDGFVDEGYEALDYPEDIDGNTYDFAIYGNQLWTVENAKMVTYRDGTEIPQVTEATAWEALTTGAWCYFDNDPTKPRLYNWYAVIGIHDEASLLDASLRKEFAPEGWHVPTDDEWTMLEEYLIANGYNYDGTTTENKIAKAMASTTGWISSTETGAVGNDQSLNNSSAFNAFPEGFRSNNGSFAIGGSNAVFWSSTENDEKLVHYLSNQNDDILRTNSPPLFGFSVRFVRD